MDYLVEFLESGARIIKDPLLIEKKKGLPNVLLNPDLTHLKGVSPSFWVKEGSTIGTLHPNESLQMVMDSLSENHPFDGPGEAPLSTDSKFVRKIEEIDAKHDNMAKHLKDKILFHNQDMYLKLNDLTVKLEEKDHLHAAQIKSMKNLGMILCFSCILAMILLKFL